jgi:hypothetical protein
MSEISPKDKIRVFMVSLCGLPRSTRSIKLQQNAPPTTQTGGVQPPSVLGLREGSGGKEVPLFLNSSF